MEQAIVQVIVEALAVPQHPRQPAGQYRQGAEAVAAVDRRQAAGALQVQRQAQQAVLQHQQGEQQEDRQVVQVGDDCLGHGGAPRGGMGTVKQTPGHCA
ncbi:hypothetical protein CRPA16_55170 [Pseudomonas aeruginosa]